MDILLVTLTVKKLMERFMKNNLKKKKKKSQKDLTFEKVMNRKDDKLYVKCKDYDNSFNN